MLFLLLLVLPPILILIPIIIAIPIEPTDVACRGSLSYTPAPSYEVLWTLTVTPVVQPGLSTPCWRTSGHRAYYKPSTSLGGPGSNSL